MKNWQKAALCIGAQSAVGWMAAKIHPAAVIPAVAVVGAAGYLLCTYEREIAADEPAAVEESMEEVCEPAIEVAAADVSEETIEEAVQDNEPICEEVRGVGKLPYHITESREFARWVQLFALHVKRSGNGNLRSLYEGLKAELELMGIFVYDEIETDEDGNVILPNEDYFIDMRTGEAWTNVPLPIIYNSERALMHGQIE